MGEAYDKAFFGFQHEVDLSNLTRFITRDEKGTIMNVIKYTRTETKDLKIPVLRSNKATEIMDYHLLAHNVTLVN